MKLYHILMQTGTRANNVCTIPYDVIVVRAETHRREKISCAGKHPQWNKHFDEVEV